MAIILPGIDEYLRPGIEKLGDTIALFTETDRATQKALRNMMVENPELAQQFADVEYKSPGTLKKWGFGQLADSVTRLGPSLALQREIEIGRREIDADAQALAFREFKYNAILTRLAENPNLSVVQLDALLSEEMGIPRPPELELEVLELLPAAMQADRARRLIESAARGDDVEGGIYDYVKLFRAGKGDMQSAADLMNHPTLGPVWESIDQMLQDRENHEQAKELAAIRLSDSQGQQGKVPLTLQNQLYEIATAKPLIADYKLMLDKWFKLSRRERVFAVTGLGSPQNQELAGEISSMRQQLSGKMRLAVIGPGAVSDQERAMLLNSIGNATSLGALIRHPQYTFGQFDTMNRSIESIEKTLLEQAAAAQANTTSSSSSTTIQFPAFLMDQLLQDPNITDAEIKAIVEAYLKERGG